MFLHLSVNIFEGYNNFFSPSDAHVLVLGFKTRVDN